LGFSLEKEEMYSDYSYGSPPSLYDNFSKLVESCGFPRIVDESKGRFWTPLVADLGSNNGFLLRIFKDHGWEVLGVDPSQLADQATTEGIPTIRAFFNSETAWDLPPVDVITCINCFGHNNNHYDFLKGIGRALRPSGYAYALIEFPYNLNMIKKNCFDVYYFEHFSEFTVKSFTYLCDRLNFKIDDIVETPTFGGSIRFKISRGNYHCNKVREYIRNENKEGLSDLNTYLEFTSKIYDNIGKLRGLITQYSKDSTVVAYGASAKSSILFNILKPNSPHKVKYIVDEADSKIGRFAPGSGLEIKSPEALKSEKNLVIVNTAWNYPIKEKLISQGLHGKIINYIPEVTVEDF
jgi:SAM-dependent methyltransferase